MFPGKMELSYQPGQPLTAVPEQTSSVLDVTAGKLTASPKMLEYCPEPPLLCGVRDVVR